MIKKNKVTFKNNLAIVTIASSNSEKTAEVVTNIEDYQAITEETNNNKWSIGNNGYARVKKNGHYHLIHRLIINPHKGFCVDHINGNKFDNRKINLREVKPSTNIENSTINKQNTVTNHRNITYDKQKGLYVVRFMKNRKVKFYKSAKDFLEAQKIAEKARKHYQKGYKRVETNAS
jgi:hypothetical protein